MLSEWRADEEGKMIEKRSIWTRPICDMMEVKVEKSSWIIFRM